MMGCGSRNWQKHRTFFQPFGAEHLEIWHDKTARWVMRMTSHDKRSDAPPQAEITCFFASSEFLWIQTTTGKWWVYIVFSNPSRAIGDAEMILGPSCPMPCWFAKPMENYDLILELPAKDLQRLFFFDRSKAFLVDPLRFQILNIKV